MNTYRIVWERSFGYSIERQSPHWYGWQYVTDSLCLTKWGAYWKLWRIQRRQGPDKVVIYVTTAPQRAV